MDTGIWPLLAAGTLLIGSLFQFLSASKESSRLHHELVIPRTHLVREVFDERLRASAWWRRIFFRRRDERAAARSVDRAISAHELEKIRHFRMNAWGWAFIIAAAIAGASIEASVLWAPESKILVTTGLIFTLLFIVIASFLAARVLSFDKHWKKNLASEPLGERKSAEKDPLTP